MEPGRKPVISTLLISLGVLSLMPQIVFADLRYDIIEDFESGSVNLVSWEDEDLNPNSWQLTSSAPTTEAPGPFISMVTLGNNSL